MFCDTELFRHSIRDESGRVLTDYKADHQPYCDCSAQYQCAWTDRFERDYVWLGSYTQLSIKRGDVPHFTVLDHLGSPRHQLNSTGVPVGINVLDAWGTQVSVNQPERTRYTGHERNNVDLDGPYLPISDYMHARTYVPMLGRFTSPDVKRTFSLFNPAAMNRYLYAASNPTRFTDPTGFAECQGTRTVSCQESETVRPNDPDEGVPTFNPTGTLNFLAESFNRQVAIGTAPGSGFVPGRFTAVTPILPASVGLMTPVAGVASPDDVLAELDWPYLEDLSNGSAGFGDGVSFGVTSVFRPEGVVDPRSASYLIGLAGGSAVNAALSGPKGPLFGRMRYRNGIPGLFNQGPLRLGWFWSQRSGRNWFGPHWGKPGSQWHGHLPLVPGPKGPAW